MRNKKLIFVATLILIVATVLCVFVGCQTSAGAAKVLLSFEADEAVSSVDIQELTKLKGYTLSGVYGNVAIVEKYDENKYETTYSLFDIENETFIVTSKFNISQAISGVFMTTYVSSRGDVTYSFYDKNGVIKSDLKSDEYDNIGNQINFADGTILVATYDGVVSLKNNLDNVMNVAYYASEKPLYKNNKVTVIGSDEEYRVFDAKGNFKKYVDVNYLVNATEDDEINVRYVGKGKIAIQVTKELTEVEAQGNYTYVSDNAYYAMTTYVYDLAKDSLKKVDFDRVIEDEVTLTENEKYAWFSSKQIISKRLAEHSSIIVINNDLKVKVELNKMVDNASEFKVVDKSTVIVKDDANTYVYTKSGLKKTYAHSKAQAIGDNYIQVGSYVYDIKGNEVMKTNDKMTIKYGTSTGLIYYTEESKSGADVFYVYDVVTGLSIPYNSAIFAKQSKSIFTLTDASGNVTAYCVYTGEAISTAKYVNVSVTSYDDYEIIAATDAKNVTTYFKCIVK